MKNEYVIYKYPLGIEVNVFTTITIFIPRDARIRSVGEQEGKLFVWAEVDSRPVIKEKRVFITVATGQLMDTKLDMKYIGTVHYKPFVSHIYELM